MDLLIPLNESRRRMEMYPAYYFTDSPDKYYYGIIIYTTLCTIFAMSVFVASDTILIYSVQHVCGLLALAGYLTEIESAYAINLFVQVGVVIISFTITLFQAATVSFNMETYHYFGFAISQFVHIFFLTVQGQFVINLQDSIYIKTYETCWYRGNVKTQALFVMIQRRNLTPPQLTAGGLIELNLDTFAEVVKVCVSYCTVLRST
ncbi:uncharacterized protein LOC108630109 isoform X2 [Ceratina calcarata]|uniref:Uncharacterized protein LOC108630109 isoform X2 n=1 Tax=Ceratina calcarata TaxID=156304 RepID=A0AAJ7WER3_9HYME|nr:uncharacterized protein LOC108630109 isoform X2 [Ceratina calcarata]